MTRKMAHSSKCLRWKHEDLSSDLQYPFKKLGVAVGLCWGDYTETGESQSSVTSQINEPLVQ